MAQFAALNSPGRDAVVLADVLQDARDDFLDVDGNGTRDALSDGLMILGHLFGAPDDQLAAFAANGATRTTGAEIAGFLDQFLPIDGQAA